MSKIVSKLFFACQISAAKTTGYKIPNITLNYTKVTLAGFGRIIYLKFDKVLNYKILVNRNKFTNISKIVWSKKLLDVILVFTSEITI